MCLASVERGGEWNRWVVSAAQLPRDQPGGRATVAREQLPVATLQAVGRCHVFYSCSTYVVKQLSRWEAAIWHWARENSPTPEKGHVLFITLVPLFGIVIIVPMQR